MILISARCSSVSLTINWPVIDKAVVAFVTEQIALLGDSFSSQYPCTRITALSAQFSSLHLIQYKTVGSNYKHKVQYSRKKSFADMWQNVIFIEVLAAFDYCAVLKCIFRFLLGFTTMFSVDSLNYL